MSKPVPVYADSPRLPSPAFALLLPSSCLTASRAALPVDGVSTTRFTTRFVGHMRRYARAPSGLDLHGQGPRDRQRIPAATPRLAAVAVVSEALFFSGRANPWRTHLADRRSPRPPQPAAGQDRGRSGLRQGQRYDRREGMRRGSPQLAKRRQSLGPLQAESTLRQCSSLDGEPSMVLSAACESSHALKRLHPN